MKFSSVMAGALASIGVRGLMESPASNFRKRGRNYKKMMKNPPNRTGWFQRRADLAPMVITERMLLRHGWYRRQLRKQGVPLVKGVLNSVMLR